MNWLECYHTHQGNNVPSKMCSMQQRLYRLNKFLGQGLGSAQPILDDSLNGTCTQIKVSLLTLTRWLSPN
jgi:hypothetical protein